MSGPSITHWSWLKRPDIKMDKGMLIDGDLNMAKPYFPGEHINSLLSGINKVFNEKTVVKFVNNFGLLGLSFQVDESEAKLNQYEGAVFFTYHTRKKKDPETSFAKVSAEVADYFGFDRGEDGSYIDLSRSRETPAEIINFAEKIRHISEIKRLLYLFIDDPYIADYDAEEWINSLNAAIYEEFIGEELSFWEEQYKRGYEATYPSFYQYILSNALYLQRLRFSHHSKRGVWVQLKTSHIAGQPDGFPVIQFDGLFRFIEYVLLAEQTPVPKRCADHKCGHLFFPNREGQNYCPPPPDKKRSLCEQRHYKEIQKQGGKNNGR